MAEECRVYCDGKRAASSCSKAAGNERLGKRKTPELPICHSLLSAEAHVKQQWWNGCCISMASRKRSDLNWFLRKQFLARSHCIPLYVITPCIMTCWAIEISCEDRVGPKYADTVLQYLFNWYVGKDMIQEAIRYQHSHSQSIGKYMY